MSGDTGAHPCCAGDAEGYELVVSLRLKPVDEGLLGEFKNVDRRGESIQCSASFDYVLHHTPGNFECDHDFAFAAGSGVDGAGDMSWAKDLDLFDTPINLPSAARGQYEDPSWIIASMWWANAAVRPVILRVGQTLIIKFGGRRRRPIVMSALRQSFETCRSASCRPLSLHAPLRLGHAVVLRVLLLLGESALDGDPLRTSGGKNKKTNARRCRQEVASGTATLLFPMLLITHSKIGGMVPES